jgi:hypothetical protein
MAGMSNAGSSRMIGIVLRRSRVFEPGDGSRCAGGDEENVPDPLLRTLMGRDL